MKNKGFATFRIFRFLLQVFLLLTSLLMIYDGICGSFLAPKNLSTLLGWVHYRGLLIISLLIFGNLFCMGCPMMTVQSFLRKFVKPKFSWPGKLRNKLPAIFIFCIFLMCYEVFSLWESPALTAAIAVTYFAVAISVDLLFKGSSFCKYICPIGQFNFISSTCSPFEVRVKNQDICRQCQTKDCIRGRWSEGKLIRKGCERGIFLPKKTSNLDCTFCGDCLSACPKGNARFAPRIPSSELWSSSLSTGVGRIIKRKDIGLLAVVFTFGSLINAFGMVSPVYALQSWLGGLLGTENRALLVSNIFVFGMLVEPLLLIGLTTWVFKTQNKSSKSFSELSIFVAITTIPLGFGIWAAHYLFHFLTGFLTIIPVFLHFIQRHQVLPDTPVPWHLTGLPDYVVSPLEMMLLSAGLLGSILVARKLGPRIHISEDKTLLAPIYLMHIILWGAAVWLMNQPMEMRGTFFGP